VGPLDFGPSRSEVQLAQALDDQLVLRFEVAIKCCLVGFGGLGDRIDADRMNAMPVEQLARRPQNARVRRGTCLLCRDDSGCFERHRRVPS